MGNRRKRNAKDDAAEEARKDRAERVFKLRCRGLTYRKIGALVGVSAVQALADYRKAIAARPLPELDQMRAEADANLRDVQRWMRKSARMGDPKAAGEFTKAIQTHAKIFGYEAPKKTEHTGAEGGPIAIASAPMIFIPPEREEPPAKNEHADDGEEGAGAETAASE